MTAHSKGQDNETRLVLNNSDSVKRCLVCSAWRLVKRFCGLTASFLRPPSSALSSLSPFPSSAPSGSRLQFLNIQIVGATERSVDIPWQDENQSNLKVLPYMRVIEDFLIHGYETSPFCLMHRESNPRTWSVLSGAAASV